MMHGTMNVKIVKQYYNQDNPTLFSQGNDTFDGTKVAVRVSGTTIHTKQNFFIELMVHYKEDIRMLGYG
jgi:hypothetical protein